MALVGVIMQHWVLVTQVCTFLSSWSESPNWKTASFLSYLPPNVAKFCSSDISPLTVSGEKNSALLSLGLRAHRNMRSEDGWDSKILTRHYTSFPISSYILFPNTHTRHNSHMDRLGAGNDWCLVSNSGLTMTSTLVDTCMLRRHTM